MCHFDVTLYFPILKLINCSVAKEFTIFVGSEALVCGCVSVAAVWEYHFFPPWCPVFTAILSPYSFMHSSFECHRWLNSHLQKHSNKRIHHHLLGRCRALLLPQHSGISVRALTHAHLYQRLKYLTDTIQHWTESNHWRK